MTLTGFGSTPKPFIAVGDRTVFDRILEEAMMSGISALTLIVSNDETIEIYRRYFSPFSYEPDLRDILAQKYPEVIAKIDALAKLQVSYALQQQALGFGHAVAQAWPLISERAIDGIVVALGDDLVCGGPPAMQQLIEIHHELGGMVFMVEEVTRSEARRFGVVQIAQTISTHQSSCRNVWRVSEVIEKPSDPKPNVIDGQERYFAVVGRYIITKDDLRFLVNQKPSRGRELDFTPLFAHNAQRQTLTAILPTGRFCTVGNAEDLQRSAIRFALEPFRSGENVELVRDTIQTLVDIGALSYKDGQYTIASGVLDKV
jgi:UTP--glucose-1-phosphate uridylyltransferase